MIIVSTLGNIVGIRTHMFSPVHFTDFFFLILQTVKRSAQHLDDDGSNILMSKVPRHTREHYPATHHTCIPESSATVGNMEMQNVQAQLKTNESCIKEGDQGETLSSDSDEDGDGEFI